MNKARSLNSVNEKIKKIISGLNEDDKTKKLIRALIEVEMQNIDKERVAYTNYYEALFNEF